MNLEERCDGNEDPEASSPCLDPVKHQEMAETVIHDDPSKVFYTDEDVQELELMFKILQAQTELKDADLRRTYAENRELKRDLEYARNELRSVQTEMNEYKDEKVGYLVNMLNALNLQEEAENYLKKYEKRFGSREKLDKLLQMEKNKGFKHAGNVIDGLIYVCKYGIRKKTFGEKLIKNVERFTDCIIYMMGGAYRALLGKTEEIREKPYKPFPIRIKDCG